MSLHHVLGLLAKLTDTASAPTPDVAPDALSQADYTAVQARAADLVRNWRPGAQGQSFLWRDVIDETSLDIRLYNAETALERLRGNVDLNASLADAFDLSRPSDAPQIAALTEHQQRGVDGPVPEQWLTTDNWQALSTARTDLEAQIRAVLDAEADVRDAAGVEWRSLPAPDALPPAPAPVTVSPSPIDLTGLTVDTLRETASRFESQATMLSERTTALAGVATGWGLPEVATFGDADRVIALIGIRSRGIRLERTWFTADGLPRARAAVSALREQVGALASAEATAQSHFNREALQAPLNDLQDRFTNLHKGLRKLSGDYRADKKTVASLLTSASSVKEGISHLSDAIAWAETTQTYERTVTDHADALGGYWNGRDTDFAALGTALATVEEVLGLLNQPPPSGLVTYLCGTEDNQPLQSLADTTKADLDNWRAGLAPAPALSGRPDLLGTPLASAIVWLTGHVTPMRQAVGPDRRRGSRHRPRPTPWARSTTSSP